jgi:hypothetical protein
MQANQGIQAEADAGSGLLLSGPGGFVSLTRGYERVMKSFVEMAARQIDLSSELIRGSLQDLSLLAQAHTPDALVQAELEVLHRESQRALLVLQQLTEQLRQGWVGAFETTQAGTATTGGVTGAEAADVRGVADV